MNARRLRFFGALAMSLFAASTGLILAQSVVTDPVGFTTLTVAAKPPASRGFTYIALNMFRPTAYRAAVTSVTTVGGFTVLTFPAASFTANQFTGAGNANFIELAPSGSFTNAGGTNTGIISDITANTTNTITLADNITGFITGGTSAIKVRPHWTFATAFGANNSAGFQGSNTPTNADALQLLNGSTGVFTSYFYSTTNTRWQNGGVDASTVIIRPDQCIQVERKVTSPVSFTLVGEVKLGPTEILIQGGNPVQNFNLVSNPYPLNSVTLAASGLFTGSPSTGVVGSNTATNADTLAILNPATGLFTTYFYSTVNSRWQNGGTDASAVVIPEGAGVLITRKLGRVGFMWVVPQPTMNL